MPELPEVEHYRQVSELVLGRTIEGVLCPDLWYLKGGTTAEDLHSELLGRSLVAARRIGKLLILDIDSSSTTSADHDVRRRCVGIRFGMTGTLLVDGVPSAESADTAEEMTGRLVYGPSRRDPVWERWRLDFDGGVAMVVHDPRRLGGVTLDPETTNLGPDALSIGLAELRHALADSSAPLKARLLDQSRIAGVGNLIADEVLWRAGFSPIRQAGALDATEVRRLHRHLRSTVDDLIAQGGSHRGDLMDERHRGGACPRDGEPLRRDTVGGRTTWWCPEHQI